MNRYLAEYCSVPERIREAHAVFQDKDKSPSDTPVRISLHLDNYKVAREVTGEFQKRLNASLAADAEGNHLQVYASEDIVLFDFTFKHVDNFYLSDLTFAQFKDLLVFDKKEERTYCNIYR